MAGKVGRGMAGASKARGAGEGRKLTARELDNAALHYLGRFASSSANLRRVLLRKVARAAKTGADTGNAAALIEALIARYLESGLLDDRVYAAQAAASLARRGGSRFSIGGKLAQKGVAAELVKEALRGLDEGGDSEIAAACALARRRRLGPYRPASARAQWRRKDMASLARAGFGLDLARRILDARDVEALEAFARGDPES
jgi:regulatory protein